MFGIVQKTAETWFVAGTTSLLEQRMHGFKELSAYLPAEERNIADHEAWIRYGEPYSGARRKAGYLDAADFLLKAYAAIAARLIEREGWPEPASQPANLAIVAALAIITEDGESVAAYDTKTVQADRAERARLKLIQEEEDQRRKEQEAAWLAHEAKRKHEQETNAARKRVEEEQKAYFERAADELEAARKRIEEERKARRGAKKGRVLNLVPLTKALGVLTACLLCVFGLVVIFRVAHEKHDTTTIATSNTSHLAPAIEAESVNPAPPEVSASTVENPMPKGDAQTQEQHQLQEQAQREWEDRMEKLRQLQIAREAMEKDRQTKENEQLLRLQKAREANEKDRQSAAVQLPSAPTAKPLEVTPRSPSRNAITKTCHVTHQTMDGIEVAPVPGLQVIIKQTDKMVTATIADLTSVAPILGIVDGTTTAGWRLRERGAGAWIASSGDTFSWLVEDANKKLIMLGSCP